MLDPALPKEKLLLPPKMLDPSDVALAGSLAPKIGVEIVVSVLDEVVTGVVFKDDEKIDLADELFPPKMDVVFSLLGLEFVAWANIVEFPKILPPEFVILRVLLSTEDVLLLKMLAEDPKNLIKFHLKKEIIKKLLTYLQKAPLLSHSPCFHSSS